MLFNTALIKNERGFSLVIVMGVLTAFIILAAGLTLTSTTDVRIAGNQRRSTQALATAEAGINEVIQRMMLASTDSLAIADTMMPLRIGWKVEVLLNSSVPGPSGDTSYTSSVQVSSVPTADWLDYSTSSPGPEALSIKHKTNLAGDKIYFYDTNSRVQFLDDPTYNGPFYPVEVIEATGRDGKAKRHIIAEICRAPILPLVTSSFTSNIKLKLQGTVNFCGHNHVANTPGGTEPPACSLWHMTRADTLPHPMPCPVEDPKCTAVRCIPGILTTGDSIKIEGAAVTYGNPDSSSDSSNPFYEIWEVLGYETEADMDDAINWKSSTSPVDGFTKVEGDLHLTGNTEGKGVLWVRGDLLISGNYRFRGIIYVNNDFHLTGNSWILGSIIVKGEFVTELTPLAGTADVLYSSRAIQDMILESLGGYTILTWREKY